MEELAILGGTPVRENKIYYGRQWIEEDDISAVGDVLRSNFITCGPMVSKVEKELAAYTGGKICRCRIQRNSGTSLCLHCCRNQRRG